MRKNIYFKNQSFYKIKSHNYYLLIIFLSISPLFSISGCKAIEEFTNMKILKIESFSPSSGRIDRNSVSSAELTFSEDMDKSRTEDSFTLKKDSSPVNGIFSWKGRTLSFIPINGFEENSSYKMELSTNAEDIYGNSLPEKFVFSFSTAAESEIPCFISSIPPDRGGITDPLQTVTIVYSESLKAETVFSSFSIFPVIKGHLALDSGDSSIIFTPLEKYTEGSDYTVTLSEDLSDIAGNNISSKTEIFFTMAESEKANLAWLGSVSGTEYGNSETVLVNSSVEKDVKIRMLFDRAVSEKVKQSPLKIYPDAEHSTEWNPLSTEAVITFANTLEYKEVYEITADEKTYRLLINGGKSKPPVLNRIVFCNDSTAPVFNTLSLNEGINFQTSEKAFFDFYLTLSDTASIHDSDIFSSISFKTVNGDLTVKPLRVNNPQSGLPAPSPPGGAGEYIFRIECSVSAGTQTSPFRIEINSEFKDSLSNRIENGVSMQVTSL